MLAETAVGMRGWLAKESTNVLSLVHRSASAGWSSRQGGASRHQAAERFGGGLDERQCLCGQFAPERHVAPSSMGSNQRSHWIVAYDGLILPLYEAQPGIYLHKLRRAGGRIGPEASYQDLKFDAPATER